MDSTNSSQRFTTSPTVSIIGAGVMGRGIAAAAVRAGMTVRLSDSNIVAAEDAVQQILTQHESRAGQYLRLVDPTADPIISVATDDSEIANADLIIEAVTENYAIKSAILSRIEPHLRSGAIMASNSSSLSLTQFSKSLQQPGRFCGLHFCHPVSERLLVEVVYTDTTTSETLNRARAFATSLRMAPIVVRDSPGFLLNRLLVPYLNEALELLLDGADIDSLDRAAAGFGMPLGPLTLFDEFGVDVAIAVGRSLYQAFPERIVPSELLIAMYKSGRLGRKSGGGFYSTQADANAGQVDRKVQELIQERRRSQTSLPDDIVRLRLFLPMLLEATRAVEESLMDRPSTIDAALRNGLGMCRPDCGIFSWANAIGAARLLNCLQPLQTMGQRFEPTQLLLNAAESKKPFFQIAGAA
jgi:3-hydroxyacyl-CoA dehydrogenase